MKTMIAIPCMDMVHTEFMKSLLKMDRPGESNFVISCSSLIYDARNTMARMAIKQGFDRVLWLDSDMTFEKDLMERLSKHLDEGKEFISGIYFTRKVPIKPVLYKECGFVDMGEGRVMPRAVWYDHYPKDSLFKAEGTGFGCVMMTTKLLEKVYDAYGLPFSPMLGFGEDLSFCARATELGTELWVDSSIKCGHMGLYPITEDAYVEVEDVTSGEAGTENTDNGVRQ